jgi:hypothetical protein
MARPLQTQPIQPPTASNEEAPNAARVIREGVIVVQESSSDDMWVRPRIAQNREDRNNPDMQGIVAGTGRRMQRIVSRDNRNEPMRTQHVQLPQRRCRVPEASESSAVTDSDSSCVETDTNARSQYRDAILGVRNAMRGRQQMRARTEHCPVCAQFASFLAHFL